MAVFIAMALSWLSAFPLSRTTNEFFDPEAAMSDSLTVSLITCYPGPEVYELYGHEAIRVRGEGRDSVWNYGIFDFRAPNFVYRFVKGETDYICAGYPFAWFLPEYAERGSKVVEQDLNMTQAEAHKLLAMLQRESLPENRTYRYNYVKDNCATRILDRLEQSLSSPVIYPDSINYGTFRNEMRSYNKDYPWYQFGIDIALGSGIDYPLSSREEMFVPVEMMKKTADAKLLDGRPMVRETRVLIEGVPDATLGPGSPWLTPLVISWVVAILLLTVCLIDIKRGKLTRWVFVVWFSLLGISGTVVWFLVFISTHEATSPNTLLLWLSPVQLLTAAVIGMRRLKNAAIALSWYNIVALISTLVIWPFQKQSGNPAFFPLIGITLLMAVTYVIVTSREKMVSRERSQSFNRKRVRQRK
ncbi:MAG: DUF4105 domain-containing protein [Muribaculaceae bacterium]|nr:DUF4105 domain-containing protein [Muribaculaceae bacterium]MDE6755223.1 DUF4105 domain-containing protein [Muribaculaceae bacterium]